ncbi:uncharacterized protein LOC107997022 [Apis cerana]|uniref:Uncharacterized protein n=1 Tax=Apis cerana cerana TaxID=94128 RepID=A0A2A3EFR4_APICC|nr:uncharacterized protein LOC107997022 [Apis cerana]PBC30558.1 hypothetical protein APICC_02725 [Apis cerana cerana]
MDNIYSLDTSHVEKDLEYKKSIHKRRSSVFQSRQIIFDECEGTEDKETVENREDIKCVSNTTQEKVFNLEEYIINLRNERKEWIETLKQRKTQRKNLTKQKLCLENQEQLLDLNILSEYEKTFVTARPSYQHICKNYEKLSDMLVKLSVLYNLAYKLNQRFISQMERRLCKITDKIIKISES